MAENNNDMAGFGGMGWLIVILLFFMAFNGGGIFGGAGNNANGAASLNALERDVLRGQAATDNAVLSTSCATQKEVLQNRYDNQSGLLLMQGHLDRCCCDVITAIHSDGEQTRQLITGNIIQGLRDQVVSLNTQYNNLQLSNNIVKELRPCPVPAYSVCSPYTTLNNNCNPCMA